MENSYFSSFNLSSSPKKLCKQDTFKNHIKRKYIAKESHDFLEGIDNEGNKIINQYTILYELGQGAFSKVNLCIDVKTSTHYACKEVDKKVLASKKKGIKRDKDGKIIVDNYLKDSLREIAILKKIECPNIIQLREIIHDDVNCKMYLINDFAEKGNILDFEESSESFTINKFFDIDNPEKLFYTIEEIKEFIRGITLAIDYCKFLIKCMIIMLFIEILSQITFYLIKKISQN